MANQRIYEFDVGAEADRYFDDSSLSNGEQPRIVMIVGAIAAGKTTFRKQRFSTGYVLVDAAEIFLSLSRGEFYSFPALFEGTMEMIGGLVALQAISERRHIVTELIGSDFAALANAMRAADYFVSTHAITCPVEEALRRNAARDEDNISCYFTEPYQRRWLLEAANAIPKPGHEEA